MKKNLSVLLIAVMLLSGSTLMANGVTVKFYGDVNDDRSVDITDATHIQFYVSQKYLVKEQLHEAADLDGDSEITVMDSTILQRYLANIITQFPVGRKQYYIHSTSNGVTINPESSNAVAGETVTFTPECDINPKPAKAYLYIDGQLVSTSADDSLQMSYTFESAGTYRIDIEITDKWGFCPYSYSYMNYTVQQPNLPTGLHISDITVTGFSSYAYVHADVIGGSTPYSYSYVVLDENNDVVYENLNTDSNSPVIEGNLKPNTAYRLFTTVTDADGYTVLKKSDFTL